MTSSSSAPSSSTNLLRHPLSCPSRRPPPEDLENSWILEFVLRQPIPDSLAHEIFLSLPFSSPELHPRLSKTLLLRRLSSDLCRCSISERTLDSLELIEELDRVCGTGSSNHMKAAYCAAAVQCTDSAYRRGSGDFRDAVERIWMERIYDLMLSEASAGLVSELLVKWWKKVIHCLSSGDGSEELFKKDVENAMRLVKDYVDEAMEEMGPSFLEIAATELAETRMDLDVSEDKSGRGVTEVNGCLMKLDEEFKELEDYGVGHKGAELAGVSVGVLGEGEIQDRSGGLVGTSCEDLEGDRARKESVGLVVASTMLDKDHNIVMESSQEFVEVEADDNIKIDNVIGHGKSNHSGCLNHKIDSSEVSKVMDALKRSCFDLNMVVEDPLPEAQAAAAAVLAGMSHDHVLQCESLRQTSENAISPVPDIVDSRAGSLEDAKHNDAGPSKSLSIVSCRTIFERNPTAHTWEWSDDSLDSFEESPVPTDNRQSPNPMRRRVCIPILGKPKFVRRRAVKRWTSEEEDTLKEAVAKYGRGNWKLILISYPKIFEERTEVDLKDKWRNLRRRLS